MSVPKIRINNRRRTGLPVWCATLVMGTVGCGGYAPTYLAAETGDTPTLDQMPVLASAGADREVLWGYPAKLNASATYHPEGRSFELEWVQLEGEPVQLSNPTGEEPSFMAPLTEQTLVFQVRADDGRWTTTDIVKMNVKSVPQQTPPWIQAVGDRISEGEEETAPDDVAAVSADTEVLWTTVEPTTSAAYPSNNRLESAILPTIRRVTGTRGGLESAPDYLLLFRRAPDDDLGNHAPIASLIGPTNVLPGEEFHLDATASADVNGDSILLRWVQPTGSPILASSDAGQSADFTRHLIAPTQPQELQFLVFARDGLLESGPARVSVLVSPPEEDLRAEVSPELRTHAGNAVFLEARSQGVAADDTNYQWQQTIGEVVDLAVSNNGRLAEFTAPTTESDLAFAVTASVLDGADNQTEVSGQPSVARVMVLPVSENTAPEVFLCASNLDPEPGSIVALVARISDPEGDAIGLMAWVDIEETGIVFADETNPDLGVCADITAPAPGTRTVSTLIEVPQNGEALRVGKRVCDNLGACETFELTLNP